MPVGGPGPYQLRKLSARLREAGDEGKGLRRELLKAVTAAARPLAKDIRDPARLHPYLPGPYADVLAADLSVTTSKRTGRDPGISLKVKGRVKKRHVRRIDDGTLMHPLWGDREHWYAQRQHVQPGAISDPFNKAAPAIRAEVLKAMHDVGKRVTS